MAFLEVGIRALLATVFAVAAVSKVRTRRAFADYADSLSETGVLPLARVVAAVSVLAEASATVLLVIPGWNVPGLGLASALLAAFVAGIALVLRRGAEITCRCFGAGSRALGRGHLLRNGILLFLALGGLATQADVHPLDLLAVSPGVLLGLCATRWDDLAFLIGSASGNRTPIQETS